VGRKSRRVAVALLGLLAVTTAALGFGMGPADARRVRAFADAVQGWQANPDFRSVSAEYVTLGVEAMRARVCGLSAGTLVMAFRSIPKLPAHLAVNDTSAAHYDAFSRGDVSAYLHLASEQGFADGVELVERLAARQPLTDNDIAAFLAGFKLPVPTVTDAGAVAGVRRLLADVGPGPFTVRSDVATPLRSHVLGNLAAMSRAEEAAAFAPLDSSIHGVDLELWRAKQVNDFLAGIWAQGYGQIYLDGIDAFFRLQRAARIGFLVALAGVIWVALRVRVRRTKAASSPGAPLQSLAAAKPG
jgi:hypothetical protein